MLLMLHTWLHLVIVGTVLAVQLEQLTEGLDGQISRSNPKIRQNVKRIILIPSYRVRQPRYKNGKLGSWIKRGSSPTPRHIKMRSLRRLTKLPYYNNDYHEPQHSEKAPYRLPHIPRYFQVSPSDSAPSFPFLHGAFSSSSGHREQIFSKFAPEPFREPLVYIRPRREAPTHNPAPGVHRKNTQEAIQVQKRGGPWCMRRCLEARLLHPAQCHALC